jgi:hypothetical protein
MMIMSHRLQMINPIEKFWFIASHLLFIKVIKCSWIAVITLISHLVAVELLSSIVKIHHFEEILDPNSIIP